MGDPWEDDDRFIGAWYRATGSHNRLDTHMQLAATRFIVWMAEDEDVPDNVLGRRIREISGLLPHEAVNEIEDVEASDLDGA